MPAVRETPDEIWKGDLLGRRLDAEFLLRFLRSRIVERGKLGMPQSYVLNVDAKWGDGKSFFMDRLAKTLVYDGHLVASVNAWKDDHADDPLLSVMAAIDVAIAPLTASDRKVAAAWERVRHVGARVAVAAAKGAAFHWARKLIGEGADEAVKAGAEAVQDEVATLLDERAEVMLADFTEGQRSIETFRTELAAVLATTEAKGIPSPMFVLVDELDRCRPPYAIALLERIKHLFEIDNVVFVIATDTGQLQHAVGAVYGSGFDSKRYLLRFFDRSYSFDEPELYEFVGSLLLTSPLEPTKVSIPPNIDLQTFLTFEFVSFGLSLRDCAQCYDLVRTVATAWDRRVPLELAALVPLAVGHLRKLSPDLGTDFVDRLLEQSDREGAGLRVETMPFIWFDEGKRQDQQVSVLDLFREFAGASSEPLHTLLNMQPTTGPARWVYGRLSDELSLVHNGQIDRRTKSILGRYASAVRSAGRLIADRG